MGRNTMYDVARQAGVSVATVSRCFSGRGPVGAQTRQRIERVAEELRFVPNRAAQSLRAVRTHTLGVVVPDLHGAFFSELLRGLDQAARAQRYHLLVAGSHGSQDDIRAALRSMSGRVDGLVVMSPDVSASTVEANLPPRLPVVLLGGRDGQAYQDLDTLGIDNRAGARAMMQHLLGLGHRRIAYIAGAHSNHDAAERLRAYRETMADTGLSTDGLVFEGDFTEAAGYRYGERLAGLDQPPTAVFAANDATAIGAISALRACGRRVPTDMAVVGFDDIPLARYVSPPLTSVHVPISELGTRAVERLGSAIEAATPLAPQQETLPTTLVVRASCGASENRVSP